MASPPTPPRLEDLAGRPFSFYPPILGVEHNEWTFEKASWSEVLVKNTKQPLSIWIPRVYLGEVSRVDEPVMIVGLNRELEYKAGSIWPHSRRVIEMPGGPPKSQGSAPANEGPVTPELAEAFRKQRDPERIASRLIAATLIGVSVLVLVAAILTSGLFRKPKAVVAGRDQLYLELTRTDDYFAIVRRLGPPTEDRWKRDSSEIVYRVLWYKNRNYYIVLMGAEKGSERYVGALSADWKPLHFVELSRGNNTLGLLRTLERF